MTVVSVVYICLDRGVLLPVGESVSQVAGPMNLLAFVGSQSLLILSDFSYLIYLAFDLSLIVSKR